MMARHLITASAQMGPISKSETRKDTVARLLAMMREAHARGAKLVVFTEMALTTFFPRWMIADEAELDSYYETAMPSAATLPLFDEAAKLGIGFYLGYAELVVEGGKAPFQHINSCRSDGPHRRQIPQGSSARLGRTAAEPGLSASGKALL
jgi:predicted amidohydrolase